MKLQKLKLRLTLLEPILGTCPADPHVYKTYIASKAPKTVDADGEVATVPIEEIEKKGYTTFHKDGAGLFLYDYAIRGFLKSAGNVLKDQSGVKNARSKIDNFVFVFPRKVHFRKAGKFVGKPDGVLERPLRAQTAQGPRVTLARSDFIDKGAYIDFEIGILENSKGVTEEWVLGLFDYAQLQGLGQFRGGSYGRASWELLDVKTKRKTRKIVSSK